MRPPVNWKRSLAVLQGLLLVSPRRILAGGEHAARQPTDRGRTDITLWESFNREIHKLSLMRINAVYEALKRRLKQSHSDAPTADPLRRIYNSLPAI